MLHPARALANQFLVRSTLTLLATGCALSLIDFAALYSAAAKEGVLHIPRGVGLLDNYGLLATLIANGVVINLAKVCVDAIQSITKSKAVTDLAPLQHDLSMLTAMLRMQRQYRFLMFLLVSIGTAFWLSNIGFHLFGNPEARWGNKVFDSPDHWLSFVASRFHLFYSWIVVLPFLAHVMVCSCIQMRRIIQVAVREKVLIYDLLNPDLKGGFLFVDKAHMAFNAVAAIVYVEITLHIETFAGMHLDHLMAYITVTLMLIGINRIFLGDVYSTIKTLRVEALNNVKEKVYRDDKLSFEILKYCYERRLNEFSLVNFAIKASAIMFSGAVKFGPTVFPAIQRILR